MGIATWAGKGTETPTLQISLLNSIGKLKFTGIPPKILLQSCNVNVTGHCCQCAADVKLTKKYNLIILDGMNKLLSKLGFVSVLAGSQNVSILPGFQA